MEEDVGMRGDGPPAEPLRERLRDVDDELRRLAMREHETRRR